MEHKQSFEYTYSAEQQKEIAHIRSKYLPPEEDKMERLRKLHHIPTAKAQSASIALGVIGTLTLGSGMSLIMTDMGASLGIYALVLGITNGMMGLVLTALAYPVYNKVLKDQRKKIAPEILRLTDELLN